MNDPSTAALLSVAMFCGGALVAALRQGWVHGAREVWPFIVGRSVAAGSLFAAVLLLLSLPVGSVGGLYVGFVAAAGGVASAAVLVPVLVLVQIVRMGLPRSASLQGGTTTLQEGSTGATPRGRRR